MEQVMRVSALEVTGYQWVLAEINILTSESVPQTPESFEKRKGNLEILKKALDQAVIGLEILRKCQRGTPFDKNLSLGEAAKLEKAYMEVNNFLLPPDDQAKNDTEKIALFQKISRICEEFFAAGNCPDEERKFLKQFCKKAQNRLDWVREFIKGGLILCRI